MGGGGGPFGAIGGIFGAIGDHDATAAEVRALKLNGNWFMEQAEFARQSTVRELRIHQRDTAEFYGEQVSGIARGGLDMSGSPLLLLAQTKMIEYEEREAIKAQGEINFKEASLKGTLAFGQASATKSAGAMRDIGNVVGIAGAALGSGGRKR